jgi:hypothetical protein
MKIAQITGDELVELVSKSREVGFQRLDNKLSPRQAAACSTYYYTCRSGATKPLESTFFKCGSVDRETAQEYLLINSRC